MNTVHMDAVRMRDFRVFILLVEALCAGLRFLRRLESMRHGGNHPISK
jgi:hypothetical protein